MIAIASIYTTKQHNCANSSSRLSEQQPQQQQSEQNSTSKSRGRGSGSSNLLLRSCAVVVVMAVVVSGSRIARGRRVAAELATTNGRPPCTCTATLRRHAVPPCRHNRGPLVLLGLVRFCGFGWGSKGHAIASWIHGVQDIRKSGDGGTLHPEP